MGEWTFEKDDFLTPAPYEALYKFHKEPFVHATKMAELASYADSVKFKGFKAMYKRYVESLKVPAGGWTSGSTSPQSRPGGAIMHPGSWRKRWMALPTPLLRPTGSWP